MRRKGNKNDKEQKMEQKTGGRDGKENDKEGNMIRIIQNKTKTGRIRRRKFTWKKMVRKDEDE